MTYSDCDILGGSKCPVEQETNERGIESIFGRELGEEGIGHTLGHDDSTDSETCRLQLLE